MVGDADKHALFCIPNQYLFSASHKIFRSLLTFHNGTTAFLGTSTQPIRLETKKHSAVSDERFFSLKKI